MRIRMLLAEMAVTLVATFLAAVCTTLLWNLGAHGLATVDWATSARLAIMFGVGLPVTRRVATRRAGKSCRAPEPPTRG
jgi:hypothetical protein